MILNKAWLGVIATLLVTFEVNLFNNRILLDQTFFTLRVSSIKAREVGPKECFISALRE
jgi:hypothetical protein